MNNIKSYYTLIGFSLVVAGFSAGIIYHRLLHAAIVTDPIQACVVLRETPLTYLTREKIAHCLGWQVEASIPVCHGAYHLATITPLPEGEVQVGSDTASLYAEGRSLFNGQVEVRQEQQIISAQTAYIYRDAKTNAVKKIELLGGVRYLEPDRLVIAKKAVVYPQDKSGVIEDVLYRFRSKHAGSVLPAWGRATLMERFSNQNYVLRKATYTTCSPRVKSWQLLASKITLDHEKERGVARNAVLSLGGWPVLYTPYFNFPTTKKRKSGFLAPMYGYSNIGGVDLAFPYYLNLAPNYDATIVPHVYTLRGLMMGGEVRFLTERSGGNISGNFLPKDRGFSTFIKDNQGQYPSLRDMSSDRWLLRLHEGTSFTSDFHLVIIYQRVSDDYYLQDFSNNLSVMTENQLLQQGDLTYTTDHWLMGGMLQSYQTLHPVNQSAVSDVYERLPQLLAKGSYHDLPLGMNFEMLNEFDYYHWPTETFSQPQGPRYHLNPLLSRPFLKPWGYVTPSIQVVENYYDVKYDGEPIHSSFNRTIPRASLDSGLFFERPTTWMGSEMTQTLEPRLYYLYVPYRNQTSIPVYDSGYMIFNYDQLFRTNRFSGFDRIGDNNYLSYAVTTRWLSEESGQEKISFSIGQIRYFDERRVQLCYQQEGTCVDNPLMLGYLSPVARSSPIASRATYQISPYWVVSGDYVWDVYTNSTNNGNVNFHYQPVLNHIINFGYSYLSSGNLLQQNNSSIQNKPLNQAIVAYAWPLNENWSSLGAYSYNISERYNMMAFMGLQYDSCCWAMRLMAGRIFKSLSPGTLVPQYNNSVYVQVLLKGLGSVANADPATTIRSYLPSYQNMF